jgi:periplasmic protein CpxP/Spy
MSSQRKSKMLVVLVIVLVLTNLGMLYYLLQYQKEEKKSKTDKQIEWITKELQLDNDQVKRYIALRATRDSVLQPLNEHLQAAKMKMVNLLQKPSNTVPDSTVAATATEITAAQKGIEIAYYDHFRRMQALCHPEQLPRLDSMLIRMVTRISKPADKAK